MGASGGNVAGLTTAAQSLVPAPAVDIAPPSHAPPARSLSELTLNNLGPTLPLILGMSAPAGSFSLIVSVVLLFVLMVAISGVLNFATLQLMRWIRTELANDIQETLYRHMLSLPMGFFSANKAGELAQRLWQDVVLMAQTFDPIARAVIDSMTQLGLYAFLLFRTDAKLAATVAVVAIAHLFITRFLQGQIKRRTAESLEGYAELGAGAHETLSAIRVVKSFSAEEFEVGRLRDRLLRLKGLMMRFGSYRSLEAPLRELANALVVAGALLVAFHSLSNGRLTVTGFMLFIVIARQTIGPFSQLNVAFVQLHEMLGASRRVLEILHTAPTIQDGTEEAAPLQETLALRDVTFSYRPGTPVLRGISLEIRRGEVVALVGPSGAGKSTLADLLLRFHDPESGRVTWDGTDLKRFRQQSYRRHFGVVPQEPTLFNASVEENIAYGRTIDRGDVARAARIANASDFIERMPDGYRTELGDRGVRLSGGQRQRLAIARAVYGRPPLLLLDEATSSLDSESERDVQHAIEQALLGTTAVVIAHRLSTIMRANRIVVLDNGRIEAVGTHNELLTASPLYRRLYEAQFRDEPALEPAFEEA